MFVFRKIWHTLFSRNTRFVIRPFALLPAISFHQKLESIQRNTCLGITGAIEGTSIENQVQNHFSYNVGIEKQECFTKFTKVPNTILNKYLKKPMHKLQETLITFPFLTRDITSSKTLSFLPQLLNGTIQIIPFGT